MFRKQNAILSGYQKDFSKYTEPHNVPKITSVWNSLPIQLAKENKKFTYKEVQQGDRACEYEAVVEWLTLTGLVYKINKITKPDLPISGYEEISAFKLYMIDTGLLCAKVMFGAKQLLKEIEFLKNLKTL